MVRNVVAAFIGPSGTGKSTLVGSLSSSSFIGADNQQTHSEMDALENFRFCVDRLPSEISSKCSEINAYRRINHGQGSVDLIATPGRRNLWKWSDYALVDADVARHRLHGELCTFSAAASTRGQAMAGVS